MRARDEKWADEPDRAIRVAVVSDVRLMRDGLVQVIAARQAIQVVGTASRLEEALQAVTNGSPSIVLLDMSCAACFEIVRALREAAPSVNIVGFAIGDTDAVLLDCVESGIVGFVPRDGDVNDLVAAIESAARGEALCSPRLVAGLFRRLASLASSQAAMTTAPSLSAREREIVKLIDRGLSNKAIAQQLQIGLATVKNHVHNILEKLQVSRRGEAVAILRTSTTGTGKRGSSASDDGQPRPRERAP
jgi:DNA-binding NarL/FixJ family response regulator